MTSQPNTLRLFVAVELPDAWLAALAALQESMNAALADDPATPGVPLRWVRPEGIHLTLKFIGDVELGRLDAIRDQLARAVPRAPGITLSLAAVGSFEERRAPRVVWISVRAQPDDGLIRLVDAIETSLEAAGVPRERRAFRPHLTLARLPDSLTAEQRRRVFRTADDIEVSRPAPFQVQAVSLMQSFLGPGGARYERQGRWPI